MKRTTLVHLLFVFCSLSALLIACGPANEEVEQTPQQNTSYPGQVTDNSTGYPAPIIPAYPGPQVTIDESRRFTISEPLVAGDTTITGKGPANIPIKVINVSYVGELLGSGQTDSNGTFTIALSKPLEVQHVIALQLNDQSLEADFRNNPGPDYTDFPMVGLLLTTVIVQP